MSRNRAEQLSKKITEEHGVKTVLIQGVSREQFSRCVEKDNFDAVGHGSARRLQKGRQAGNRSAPGFGCSRFKCREFHGT